MDNMGVPGGRVVDSSEVCRFSQLGRSSVRGNPGIIFRDLTAHWRQR
jgi:hypothetical protein